MKKNIISIMLIMLLGCNLDNNKSVFDRIDRGGVFAQIDAMMEISNKYQIDIGHYNKTLSLYNKQRKLNQKNSQDFKDGYIGFEEYMRGLEKAQELKNELNNLKSILIAQQEEIQDRLSTLPESLVLPILKDDYRENYLYIKYKILPLMEENEITLKRSLN